MKVGGNIASTSPIERSQRTEVEVQKTAVSQADLRGAINRAHQKLTGRTPSAALLDTLTAHASLETGSGGQMYNYNFGGIKGASPAGETAKMRTKEVYGGKEVEIRDGFRSYRTLDDGATDYVRLMRDRFGAAVAKAEAGDVDGFAHALKQSHYYTADETKYASALRGLAGKDHGGMSTSSAGSGFAVSGASGASGGLDRLDFSSSANAFPDSFELGRVLDAIARHPTTVEDDDAED